MEKQKVLESLNNEFDDFFKFCKSSSFSKGEMKTICSNLQYRIQSNRLRKVALYLLATCLVCWLCLNVNFLDWSISAIGRICMIKLLPLWDWTELYNANCLISYRIGGQQQIETYGRSDETNAKNCALCENLDHLDVISDATFHYIEQAYLEKGLPVIILNSHETPTFPEFIDKIRSEDSYIETDPCDVESNFMLNRFANLDDFIRKAGASNENDLWFFHLRNCQFDAVKSSRKFIPKPSYYPQHLPPFYTSWLLMSSPGGAFSSEKKIYVEGLVIVMQMTGRLDIVLTAKEPCVQTCGRHAVELHEGESLVFLSDIWKFSYVLGNEMFSSTVITETKLE